MTFYFRGKNVLFSPYVKEAFDFVDKIFAHLSSLGMRAELLNDIYYDTYQHIGFSFMEKVIDERIVIINMGAIQQLNLDILYCLGRVGHIKCKFLKCRIPVFLNKE